ncbi:hypothetical protein [Pannonibacter carbonis]|uniref:hypothetical protein n=1 Tax=Pannonibacter carbonis TaxID=2067569 RepID=UPI00130049A7|nr:hypothetical protein [Pannonibacter carbonis]
MAHQHLAGECNFHLSFRVVNQGRVILSASPPWLKHMRPTAPSTSKPISGLGRSLIGLYFVVACGLMGAAVLAPIQGSQVAVFTWAGSATAAEVVARANGQLLLISANGRIAVTPTLAAGDIGALYDAGASLVTAAWFAKACMTLNAAGFSLDASEVAR